MVVIFLASGLIDLPTSTLLTKWLYSSKVRMKKMFLFRSLMKRALPSLIMYSASCSAWSGSRYLDDLAPLLFRRLELLYEVIVDHRVVFSAVTRSYSL